MTASYAMVGTALALVMLFASELATGSIVALAARAGLRLARRWRARARASLFFWLRVGPGVLSLAFVLILVVPSYVRYEPLVRDEPVSRLFLVVALLSGTLLFVSTCRLFRRAQATRALSREWINRSRSLDALTSLPPLAVMPVPAYVLPHEFPIVAVVGWWRPHLFIAESVLMALSADELAAVVVHELGHVAARDNLKRALMESASGPFAWLGSGRLLERRWAEATECAADDYVAEQAAIRPASASLSLAAALLKIARLVPEGCTPVVPAGAFLIGPGSDGRGVAGRVRRLVVAADALTAQPFRVITRATAAGGFTPNQRRCAQVVLMACALGIALHPRTQGQMHRVAEHLVHGFQ